MPRTNFPWGPDALSREIGYGADHYVVLAGCPVDDAAPLGGRVHGVASMAKDVPVSTRQRRKGGRPYLPSDRLGRQDFKLGDVWTGGWNVYRERFRAVMAVALIVYMPTSLAFGLLRHLSEPLLLRTQPDPVDAARWLRAATGISELAQALVESVGTVAIIYVVEQAIHERPVSWQAALRYGFTRWPSMACTILLGGLILTGLTLLLIVPAIIWAGYYALSVYAVALRGVGGKPALNYSKELVRGQWWRVSGILGLLELLQHIAVLVPALPLLALPGADLVRITYDAIAGSVAAGLFMVMNTVFFLNIDYRKHRHLAKRG